MHRIWLGGLGIVAGALMVQGCLALDWDFQAAPEGGGGAGGSVAVGDGATPLKEDCTNKSDDNQDGKTDCKDVDCEDYQCNPEVPAGWDPFWVLETSYDDPNPTVCPDEQPATKLFADPATTTTCSQCDCVYTGAACSAPTFSCSYSNASCSNWSMSPHTSNTTSCYELIEVPQGGQGNGSCTITAPSQVVNNGSCIGTPSSVTGPTTFGKELRLCPAPADQGAGCLSGESCMQRKPASLNVARTCIVKGETATCPMGWKVNEFPAYEAGNDTRTCSNCGCDVDTVSCSGGKVRLFNSNNCKQSSFTKELVNLGDCVTESFYLSHSANFDLGTPSEGTCMQAVASGTVQPTGAHTICCRD